MDYPLWVTFCQHGHLCSWLVSWGGWGLGVRTLEMSSVTLDKLSDLSDSQLAHL